MLRVADGSAVVDESGSAWEVSADWLRRPYHPSKISDREGKWSGLVQRPKSDPRNFCERLSYGVGSKVLVARRHPGGDEHPILATISAESNQWSGCLVEAACSPSICYDRETRSFWLTWYANAWSPPQEAHASPEPWDSLWEGLAPPPSLPYPGSVEESPSWPIPSGPLLVVRDLPPWQAEASVPAGFCVSETLVYRVDPPTGERVGPFDPARAWIAPWTDAFGYRLSREFIPNPPSTTEYENPETGEEFEVPQGIPVDGGNSSASQASAPLGEDVAIAREAIRRSLANQPLPDHLGDSLRQYAVRNTRIASLCRTTRVLLGARGRSAVLLREPREIPPVSAGGAVPLPVEVETIEVIVLDPPSVLAYFPAAGNRAPAHRQKWTSFLPDGEGIFITAPLNAYFPSSASLTIDTGDPQVDFLLHRPNDARTGVRKAASLPLAREPQNPPFVPGVELRGPAGIPISLVEFLSDPGAWTSF
jgi:hypothetical protein